MAEAQADVTIRGDTFENTGMQVGALSIFDPQTGHYLMELPIAPVMLGAPAVQTGEEFANNSMNSTGGGIAYEWKPIGVGGFASGALGDDGLSREEVYQGFVGQGASHLAADADWAHSAGNGTVPFGDFHFDRAAARLEYVAPGSVSDLFAGYQASFFGWPNLYTPFDSDETENLQTVLVDFNTREDLGPGPVLRGRRLLPPEQGRLRVRPVCAAWPGPSLPAHDMGIRHSGRGPPGVRGRLRQLPRGGNDRFTALDLPHLRALPQPHSEEGVDRPRGAVGRRWRLHHPQGGRQLRRLNRSNAVFSPNAELSRTWNTGALQRIYASYSVTTEMPSYTALDSSPTAGLFLGNPNLGRETSRDTEAGMTAACGAGRERPRSSTGATRTSSTGPTRTGSSAAPPTLSTSTREGSSWRRGRPGAWSRSCSATPSWPRTPTTGTPTSPPASTPSTTPASA